MKISQSFKNKKFMFSCFRYFETLSEEKRKLSVLVRNYRDPKRGYKKWSPAAPLTRV